MNLAVLVPARHEGSFLRESLEHLGRVTRGSIPIYVIADRCDDDTAAQARRVGAHVYERTDGPPGKGAAIAWFLEAAAADLADVEALIILDADSRPRPGAVEALERALASRAAAAQGFVQPVPEFSSLPSLWAAYSEWISQRLGDRFRKAMKWCVPLRGTGMAIRMEVLREAAPRLRTSVEDLELTLLVARRGVSIEFVPEAVVEDPKPLRTRGFVRQRARWLQGLREALWRHAGTVVRLVLTGGPGAWALLAALFLKPKAFWLAAKVATMAAAWTFLPHPAAKVAVVLIGCLLLADALYYGAGFALAPRSWRGPLLKKLPALALIPFLWIWSFLWSFLQGDVWLRARD
ncbi:MAG: glycosyltransferase [Planctomycetes bacterium]|nr:glycosyltransferase [Planctomycetota bacterium]